MAFLTILTWRTAVFRWWRPHRPSGCRTLCQINHQPGGKHIEHQFLRCACFIREEPVTTSAPTIGVMANSAWWKRHSPDYRKFPLCGSRAACVFQSGNHIRRATAGSNANTTSCAVKLIFFRSLTPPSRLLQRLPPRAEWHIRLQQSNQHQTRFHAVGGRTFAGIQNPQRPDVPAPR